MENSQQGSTFVGGTEMVPLRVLTALGDFIAAAGCADNETELVSAIAECISRIIVADRASLALLDATGTSLRVLALEGETGNLPLGVQFPVDGTAAGIAIRDSAPHRWNTLTEPHYFESKTLRDVGLISIANVPVLAGTQVLGTINVGRSTPAPIPDEDLTIIAEAGGVAGAALLRLRLLESTRGEVATTRLYAQQLEALGRVAEQLSRAVSRDEALAVVANEASAIVRADRFSIALLEPDRRHTRIFAVRGETTSAPAGAVLSIEESGLAEEFSTGKASYHGDLSVVEGALHANLARAGLKSAVSIPVHGDNGVIAVLNAGSKDNEFAKAESRAVLTALARLLASTLERLTAQEGLRRAQQMESLGVLAGGVAHDFNNLIGVALGNLSLMHVALSGNPRVATELAEVQQALSRASDLTRQMLAYAGKAQRLAKRIVLNDAVAQMVRLLGPRRSDRINVTTDFSEPMPDVIVDAVQLDQILINLLTNASDAIGNGGGVVTVSTAVEQVIESRASGIIPGHVLAPGRYCRFRVHDTGCGMSPEVVARIFDPFYTTKEDGHGLGLSAILGIVRAHGGDIEVISSPGEYTQFDVLLPAAGDGDVPLAGRAVLVIDDDAQVRTLIERMAVHLGYVAYAVPNAQAAMRVLQEGRVQISVVVTDLSMPGKSGVDLATWMAAHTAVPCILMSGMYRDPDEMRRTPGVVEYLEKPFDLDTFAAAIHRACISRPLETAPLRR